MTSISSTSSYGYTTWGSSSSSSRASKMAEDLFSALDTDGQGYIEQSDLESAISSLGTEGASAEDLFNALDSDADGKVTQDEMSATLEKLSQQLDGEFNRMRMEQGGMPPPPPPQGAGGEDTGFTQDELSAMASEASDNTASSLFSTLATNFEAADANGDGRVTASEAAAYRESTGSSTSQSASAAATGTNDTSTSSGSSDGQLFARLMQLASSYGTIGANAVDNLIGSSITVSA